MTKTSLPAVIATLLLSLGTGVGCAPAYLDQDASGQIGGEDWTYRSGRARLDQDGEYSISLFGEESDTPCTYAAFDEDKIIFDLPDEVGSFQLGLGTFTVTLVEDRGDEAPMNYIATSGTVETLELSDTELGGRMLVEADEANWMNGNFSLPICE